MAEKPIETDKAYERKDDFSPGKILTVLMSSLGDVTVSIIDFEKKPLEVMNVTFANFVNGGGHSPKTLIALEALALAIDEDNQRYPLGEDFKKG